MANNDLSLDQQRVLAALVEQPTVPAAATALGTTPAALRRRLRDEPELLAAWQHANRRLAQGLLARVGRPVRAAAPTTPADDSDALRKVCESVFALLVASLGREAPAAQEATP